jgi:aspartate racemase
VKAASKAGFLDIIGNLYRKGAQGVVLGCTEIPMLIGQEDTDLPVFDTTAIHAEAAVDWAIRDLNTAP